MKYYAAMKMSELFLYTAMWIHFLNKPCMKKARYKREHTIRLHLYKVQNQAKQMHDVKSPEGGGCRERRG